MKKMKMMILITCIFSASLTAPPPQMIVIPAGEAIRPYEAIWNAVRFIEIGEMPNETINYEEQAYGPGQIRQIKLDWYYNRTGIRHSLRDCFSEEVSKSIFFYHMMQYPNIDRGIKAWNGSGPKTEIYLSKVKKVLLSL